MLIPESPIKIFDREYWKSDNWDPMQYGGEYDFNKTFFDQFHELMLSVPWPSKLVSEMTNSDYCNNANNLKNCYLCFDCNGSEDCLYGIGFARSRDSMDFYQCYDIELCYEGFSLSNCYQCFYSMGLSNCHNVWFSRDCVGCQDCFGCTNLKNKQYYILNQPFTKEEYEKKLKDQIAGSFKKWEFTKKQIMSFWKSQPHKYMHGTNNTNVVGEYVDHSKDVMYCYQGVEMERVKYSQAMGRNVKDSYDYTNYGEGAELVYETVNSGIGLHNVKFCVDASDNCTNTEYSMVVSNVNDIFGCSNIKNKQYCILNKQYDQQSFNDLRTKIISKMTKDGEYGEFFPAKLSPFAYNNSVACDFYDIPKEQAEKEGFTWRNIDNKEFETTMSAKDIPDKIQELSTDIISQIIKCIKCGHAYRILDRELEFLKRFNLPAPRSCVDCRYKTRISFRNPLTWFIRECMCNGNKSTIGGYVNLNPAAHQSHGEKEKCPNKFKTSFLKENGDIIYCEQCYLYEVA